MNKIILVALISFVALIYLIETMSDSSVHYSYETGELCFSNEEVYEHRKKFDSKAPKHELLVKLRGINHNVNSASEFNSETENTMFIRINDAKISKEKFDLRFERISQKLEGVTPNFHRDLGLFVYPPKDANIGRNLYFLKAEYPKIQSANNLENINDWYLGTCIEGVGESRCYATYIYDASLVIEYDFISSSLGNWKDIENFISKSISEKKCN